MKKKAYTSYTLLANVPGVTVMVAAVDLDIIDPLNKPSIRFGVGQQNFYLTQVNVRAYDRRPTLNGSLRSYAIELEMIGENAEVLSQSMPVGGISYFRASYPKAVVIDLEAGTLISPVLIQKGLAVSHLNVNSRGGSGSYEIDYTITFSGYYLVD